MYLAISPEGTHLTADQAKILDDEFFRADPLGHFTSRISMLLASKSQTVAPTRATYPGFFDALGLDGLDALPGVGERNRDVQVSIDALALRHQCAEALERLLFALTAAHEGPDARCLWWAIADSPTRTLNVLESTKRAFDADEHLLLRLMFGLDTPITDEAVAAADTALAWINHAGHLLAGDELSINAAHNKLKHGLAVATRDDVRIDLVAAPPNDKGEVPLSAFGEGKSVPIFDRPMLTYLSRPHGKPKRGLEVVSLRVDVDTVLAETWMLATVYAALFHVAALEHFEGLAPDGLAPYPTLAIGRTPKQMLASQALGYRSPVTLPPDGVTAARPSGVFFYGAFFEMDIDLESRRQAVIVDE